MVSAVISLLDPPTGSPRVVASAPAGHTLVIGANVAQLEELQTLCDAATSTIGPTSGSVLTLVRK